MALSEKIWAKVSVEFLSKSQRVWSRSKNTSVTRSLYIYVLYNTIIQTFPVDLVFPADQFIGKEGNKRTTHFFYFHAQVDTGCMGFSLLPVFQQSIIMYRKRMDHDRLLYFQKKVIKIKGGAASCPKSDLMGIAHGIIMGEPRLD